MGFCVVYKKKTAPCAPGARMCTVLHWAERHEETCVLQHPRSSNTCTPPRHSHPLCIQRDAVAGNRLLVIECQTESPCNARQRLWTQRFGPPRLQSKTTGADLQSLVWAYRTVRKSATCVGLSQSRHFTPSTARQAHPELFVPVTCGVPHWQPHLTARASWHPGRAPCAP